jgi:hypothetical protein
MFAYPNFSPQIPNNKRRAQGPAAKRFGVSPVDLQYFSSEHMGEHKGEHPSPQKILETGQPRREKKKEAPAAPSPTFSCQHFSVTKKQDALLGEAFPWVDRCH